MVDKQRTLPELLAPAGDMERLKMAVLYGADAVYLAGTDFGMRAFAGNFDPDELKAAVAYAHAHNVRVHCTINTMPRGDEIVRLPAHLERLNRGGPGCLYAGGEICPQLPAPHLHSGQHFQLCHCQRLV